MVERENGATAIRGAIQEGDGDARASTRYRRRREMARRHTEEMLQARSCVGLYTQMIGSRQNVSRRRR